MQGYATLLPNYARPSELAFRQILYLPADAFKES
jgi:hypothetical protein